MDTPPPRTKDPTSGAPRPEEAFARRRAILQESLDALNDPARFERYRRAAFENVGRWREERRTAPTSKDEGPSRPGVGAVMKGDWGVVTRALTEGYGEVFAVLNMANAYHPGGGYQEGCVAQEENMFRRTDCPLSLRETEVDATTGRYLPAVSALLNAVPGRVYLDVERPRICVRGPENPERADLGYTWLDTKDIFPFFELRAAAQDLSWGGTFDEGEARRRIVAQLETLIEHDVRHAVLGAHGCGAFGNPGEIIARLYRTELSARAGSFECVAFAIHHAGYGPGNHAVFERAFR